MLFVAKVKAAQEWIRHRRLTVFRISLQYFSQEPGENFPVCCLVKCSQCSVTNICCCCFKTKRQRFEPVAMAASFGRAVTIVTDAMHHRDLRKISPRSSSFPRTPNFIPLTLITKRTYLKVRWCQRTSESSVNDVTQIIRLHLHTLENLYVTHTLMK